MNIPAILNELYPDAQWTLDGTSYEGLTWLSDGPAPTQQELDEAWPGILADLEVEQVHRARQSAYREEADPLFFEWQAGEGSEAAWQAKRDEIKLRFPLP